MISGPKGEKNDALLGVTVKECCWSPSRMRNLAKGRANSVDLIQIFKKKLANGSNMYLMYSLGRMSQ